MKFDLYEKAKEKIIVVAHRENLKRIGERTERKLSFKKKPEVDVKGVKEEPAESADNNAEVAENGVSEEEKD